MRGDNRGPASWDSRAGNATRGGRKHYTTTTGQKPDWAEGLCCLALFGAIPFLLMIVGVGL